MTAERFDGEEAWSRLTADRQQEIGSIVLELVSAWWLQEQSADPHEGNDALLRAGEFADALLIEQLREAVVNAMPIDSFNDASGSPLIPSRLGPVCRQCGCSQDDACYPACSWVEPDLCSGCSKPPAADAAFIGGTRA